MNKYAVVNADIAPLYKEPTEQTELADEALYGMKVELLEEPREGWYRIRTHYGYEGYTPKQYLYTDKKRAEAWFGLEKKVVLQDYADVLSRPSVQGYHVLHICRGGLLSPIGTEGNYTKVRLCDGREGYLATSYLGEYYTSPASDNEDTLRDMLVASAKSFEGCHYRWGGKSPLGIDCSGLCSTAYMLNGILIHRDAKMTPDFCMKEITREQMKKGDLIFFPGHVAMYIGDERYIHSTAAAGSERVRYNSLDPKAPDYREDLLKKITAIGSVFPLATK